MHACTHTHTHTNPRHTFIHSFTHTHTHTRTHMHTYPVTHMRTHIHVHRYTYTHIHAQHTHTPLTLMEFPVLLGSRRRKKLPRKPHLSDSISKDLPTPVDPSTFSLMRDRPWGELVSCWISTWPFSWNTTWSLAVKVLLHFQDHAVHPLSLWVPNSESIALIPSVFTFDIMTTSAPLILLTGSSLWYYNIHLLTLLSSSSFWYHITHPLWLYSQVLHSDITSLTTFDFTHKFFTLSSWHSPFDFTHKFFILRSHHSPPLTLLTSCFTLRSPHSPLWLYSSVLLCPWSPVQVQ